MKNRYFLICSLLTLQFCFAQYGYRDSNRIGIIGGMNQFNLITNDFETVAGIGWTAGVTVRGNFYNNWDMVYAVQFSSFTFSVPTDGIVDKEVRYKLQAAQLALLVSYKLIENHLSVELGPTVQLNGNLQLAEEDKQRFIKGTTLLTDDITTVSKFNFFPTVGVTAGVRHFRFNVAYLYGLNNMLSKAKVTDGGVTSLKAHSGLLTATAHIYL